MCYGIVVFESVNLPPVYIAQGTRTAMGYAFTEDEIHRPEKH